MAQLGYPRGSIRVRIRNVSDLIVGNVSVPVDHCVSYREGFPDRRTVDYWVGDDKAERHPQSRTMNNHNKADGFERRLEVFP